MRAISRKVSRAVRRCTERRNTEYVLGVDQGSRRGEMASRPGKTARARPPRQALHGWEAHASELRHPAGACVTGRQFGPPHETCRHERAGAAKGPAGGEALGTRHLKALEHSGPAHTPGSWGCRCLDQPHPPTRCPQQSGGGPSAARGGREIAWVHRVAESTTQPAQTTGR